jgi:hypothetical protein
MVFYTPHYLDPIVVTLIRRLKVKTSGSPHRQLSITIFLLIVRNVRIEVHRDQKRPSQSVLVKGLNSVGLRSQIKEYLVPFYSGVRGYRDHGHLFVYIQKTQEVQLFPNSLLFSF